MHSVISTELENRSNQTAGERKNEGTKERMEGRKYKYA
jgi:hypothetical protein